MIYILDTDHVSLLQRADPHVRSKTERIASSELATTVISLDEQLRGRLAFVNRARSEAEIVYAYELLSKTYGFFAAVNLLPYDVEAAALCRQLRQHKIAIGTQDLRIAAIALSRDAVLVTRNSRHFGLVPLLRCEDWSA
jgi:tRNA(fMet)-specific endonuclease VapC